MAIRSYSVLLRCPAQPGRILSYWKVINGAGSACGLNPTESGTISMAGSKHFSIMSFHSLYPHGCSLSKPPCRLREFCNHGFGGQNRDLLLWRVIGFFGALTLEQSSCIMRTPQSERVRKAPVKVWTDLQRCFPPRNECKETGDLLVGEGSHDRRQKEHPPTLSTQQSSEALRKSGS